MTETDKIQHDIGVEARNLAYAEFIDLLKAELLKKFDASALRFESGSNYYEHLFTSYLCRKEKGLIFSSNKIVKKIIQVDAYLADTAVSSIKIDVYDPDAYDFVSQVAKKCIDKFGHYFGRGITIFQQFHN